MYAFYIAYIFVWWHDYYMYLYCITGTWKIDLKFSEAVRHQVYIDGLSSDSAFISRIMELYHALNRGKAVILNGPSGCGKTMIYK